MTLRKFFNNKICLNLIAFIAMSGVLYSCQSNESAKNTIKKESVVAKKDSTATETPLANVSTKSEQKKVIVYYFHTTFRCQSCNMIEKFTKEAVETGFASELKSGSLEMKVINVEEKGNEHFAEDYKLYTKSVIVSNVKDGKEVTWKNLDKVWTHLGDPNKFKEYIQTEVKTSLKG
ncbi:MAG TPA: nitrophenyl compound nitroreductase subunit ArsF family protein [Chitinispirillaceae bacterium]|nr:nitrophenyl compound nitroreductase subunit ArsF family protein [Chitinispirillaceae bacterium]